jgi:hypothetical protein
MGKPMDHGSRAFVQGVISIWTKRMDCVHFSNKKVFGLKIFWKCGCPNFLFISYLFFFSLILGFLVGFYFFVFLLFCTFHTPLHIMDERKKQILVVIAMYWRLYVLIQQVLSIQALVLGYEMEKYALFVVMWEFMGRKM